MIVAYADVLVSVGEPGRQGAGSRRVGYVAAETGLDAFRGKAQKLRKNSGRDGARMQGA